jgi:rhamnosyltransferase
LPETEEVFTAITSGNIINLAVWKKIGYFNEKLFIDGVDWDYCIRLQQEGYKIVRFNNIMLEHHLGSTVQHKNIFKKDITIHQHNGLRRYYMTRNWLYLTFKYGLVYPRFSFATMKSLLREIKNILLYESGKSVKLYWVYKGFVDFLSGSYGKKNV